MEDKVLKRNLSLLVFSVVFGNVMYAITGAPVGGTPVSGFIRLLGTDDFTYGLIMALPVLGGIMQIFGSYLVESTGKRKAIFLFTGYFQKAFWLITALIPILLPAIFPDITKNFIITLVTVLIIINSCTFFVTVIAGTSILGSIVPAGIKGSFISLRTFASTISIIIAAFSLGWLLDVLGVKYGGLTAFASVIAICSLFGVFDISCIALLKIPPMEPKKEKTHFFKLMAEPLRDKNYMKFIMFFVIWNFSLNLTFPYFNIYMIEYLRMKYIMISIVTQIIAGLATVLIIRKWGSRADSHGNKPVIMICGLLLIQLPLLWLFATPGNYIVLFINYIIYGACFPAYEAAAFNLSLWLAPEKNRSIYPALATFFNSILGIALPYFLGGWFLQIAAPAVTAWDIPFIMGQKLTAYHILFVIGTLLRLISLLLFLPGFKEEGEKHFKELVGDIFIRFKKQEQET